MNRYDGKTTFDGDASAPALAAADGPACGKGEVSSGPEIEKRLEELRQAGRQCHKR